MCKLLLLIWEQIQQITEGEKNGEPADISDGPQKKLYRDYDEKVLTGVCAGLAAYFGISVVWIRIIALVLLFTPAAPFVLLIYFVFSISLTYAKTPAERMQMVGESLTLQSIEQSVKTRFGESVTKEESSLAHMVILPIQAISVILRGLPQLFRWLLQILSMLLIGIVSLIVIGLTLATGLLIFVPNSPHIVKPFPNFPASSVEVAVIVLGYICIMIPLVYVIVLAISLLKRRYILNSFTSISFFLVWLVCLVSTTVMVIRIAPTIERRLETIQPIRHTYSVSEFSHVVLRGQYSVRVIEGPDPSLTISGEPASLERLHVQTKDNILTVFDKENPSMCIFCSLRQPEVVISAPDIEEIALNGSLNAEFKGFTHEDGLTVILHKSSQVTIQQAALVQLIIDMDGVSQMSITGSAETLSATAEGMSQLEAGNLQVRDAHVNTSGISQVEVWTTDRLDAILTGTSNIEYHGDPKITVRTNHSSNLDKLD